MRKKKAGREFTQEEREFVQRFVEKGGKLTETKEEADLPRHFSDGELARFASDYFLASGSTWDEMEITEVNRDGAAVKIRCIFKSGDSSIGASISLSDYAVSCPMLPKNDKTEQVWLKAMYSKFGDDWAEDYAYRRACEACRKLASSIEPLEQYIEDEEQAAQKGRPSFVTEFPDEADNISDFLIYTHNEMLKSIQDRYLEKIYEMIGAREPGEE